VSAGLLLGAVLLLPIEGILLLLQLVSLIVCSLCEQQLCIGASSQWTYALVG
jgi:hypothetical protein